MKFHTQFALCIIVALVIGFFGGMCIGTIRADSMHNRCRLQLEIPNENR